MDGTPKGLGYFGEIARTDEPDVFSTELSTQVDDLLFPLIVPTLTREELAHLVDGGSPTKGIVEKAYRFAIQRTKDGKSPFAGPGEQHPLPTTPTAQLEEGFNGRPTTP